MQVPSTLKALWAQRKRWARGQGEVLHKHLRQVGHLRNHRMWLLSIESVASLIWVIAMAISLVLAALSVLLGHHLGLFAFGFASSASPWRCALRTTAGTCGRS
jgi:cellulose synthase/poly-beta-1,6-N-acetylglucosamine synthase-like glycosyltransferase